MKPDLYKILSRNIEEGIAYGWSRSHKYIDDPTPDHIKDQIHEAVMNEICEYFQFEDQVTYQETK